MDHHNTLDIGCPGGHIYPISLSTIMVDITTRDLTSRCAKVHLELCMHCSLSYCLLLWLLSWGTSISTRWKPTVCLSFTGQSPNSPHGIRLSSPTQPLSLLFLKCMEAFLCNSWFGYYCTEYDYINTKKRHCLQANDWSWVAKFCFCFSFLIY